MINCSRCNADVGAQRVRRLEGGVLQHYLHCDKCGHDVVTGQTTEHIAREEKQLLMMERKVGYRRSENKSVASLERAVENKRRRIRRMRLDSGLDPEPVLRRSV